MATALPFVGVQAEVIHTRGKITLAFALLEVALLYPLALTVPSAGLGHSEHFRAAGGGTAVRKP